MKKRYGYIYKLKPWQKYRVKFSFCRFRMLPKKHGPELIANYLERRYWWLFFEITVVNLGVAKDETVSMATFKAKKVAEGLYE